jgi:hypothetical protein
MKKTFFTSIFCIFATTSLVFAQEVIVNPCDTIEYRPPVLNFTTSYGRLDYNFDLDSNGVTALGNKYGLVEKGMFASGLSVSSIDWEVSLETIARVADDYSICVVPATVSVFVGLQRPTVYIANDIAPDSCQFYSVVRHENQHQQINVIALEYFMPKIKAEIQKHLEAVKPRLIASIDKTDAATAQMNDEYIAVIEPFVNKFKASIYTEQKKLDSRENYEYESNLCSKPIEG